MLRPSIDTLLGHDLGAALAPLDPADADTFARRPPTRNPGLAAPAGGASAQPPPAGAARDGGPLALGPALAPLDPMAYITSLVNLETVGACIDDDSTCIVRGNADVGSAIRLFPPTSTT